ncbi:MAG: sigma-54-dependent Fis family transcriptional regulator, partial [Candidatus Eisenbacteria bacterium]|nr:sigma-54-dependent Fis family transcriptional regulator [Candidatus Eisenbacteria bacterium]
SDGGTLFLDEIGDMPLEAQVKLLRVLENNEVRRVGENSAHLVDLRVVAATHRDLHEEIAAGRFREDLYYRLSVVTIEVPALRERREDIGLLAEYFLARISKAQGKPELEFSPEAIQLLERYDYPGNVRELENVIAHVVTLSEGPIVTAQDLPDVVRAPRLLTSAPDTRPAERERRPRPLRASLGPREVTVPDARDHWTLAEVEQEHILRVLDRCRGNATAAARQLGISRTTLWRKLREYGVSRPERTGE